MNVLFLIHTLWECDGEGGEHVILEREARALGGSVGELEEFRPMFGIGSHAVNGPRGKEMFLGGDLSKDHTPDESGTCIKRRALFHNWIY